MRHNSLKMFLRQEFECLLNILKMVCMVNLSCLSLTSWGTRLPLMLFDWRNYNIFLSLSLHFCKLIEG